MNYAEQNLVIVSTETYSSANKVKYFKVTSDNDFLARIFDCWKAGKIFSILHLDLNLSQQDLQNFENRSKINVFMAKMNYR